MGLSLGAVVAIRLVSRHPEIALIALVSGYQIYTLPSFLFPIAKYVVYSIMGIESFFSDAIQKAMPEVDFNTPREPRNLKLIEGLCETLGGPDGTTWPAPWPARTLIIAAGKPAPYIGKVDSPEDARKLEDIGKKGNDQTVAVVHKGMRHPWSRQDGPLFARTITAWIERGVVIENEGFDKL